MLLLLVLCLYTFESFCTEGQTSFGIVQICGLVCKWTMSCLLFPSIASLDLFYLTVLLKVKQTNLLFRFAECYVTIIVSCAPAMSSFWLYTFTKSAFYSSVRSSSLFSRASRSTVTKSSSPSALQKQSPYPGSSSNLANNSNGYHELYDGAFSKPDTDIRFSGKQPSGDQGIITKSTTIAQVSEMKG